MKPRFMSLIVLIFALAYVSGCGFNNGGVKTGIPYILEQSQKMRGNGPSLGTSSPANSIVGAGPKKEAITTKGDLGKRVFLTFDDGPDATITPAVLDVLDTYGVKATFFVIGTKIEENPELLKEIVRRGNALGNHTYSHKYSDVYSSTENLIKSFKENEELIFRLTGQKPQIVRDPGGEVRTNKTLKQKLANNGYTLVDWNVDSRDSSKPQPTGPEIVENVRQQSLSKHLWPNMVILMHDGRGHLNTVRALPTIIEMLLAEGFQFEVIH